MQTAGRTPFIYKWVSRRCKLMGQLLKMDNKQ